MTASVQDHQKCSQCDAEITADDPKYKQYVQTLEFLFPTIDACEEFNTATQSHGFSAGGLTSHIVITTLSGDSTTRVYNPDQTILSLKNVVEQELKTPCNKQCLLFKDTELKVFFPLIKNLS